MTDTVIPKDEWSSRATAQFQKRLPDWNEGQIKELVEVLLDEWYEDFSDDPEGAVDEELSNWD